MDFIILKILWKKSFVSSLFYIQNEPAGTGENFTEAFPFIIVGVQWLHSCHSDVTHPKRGSEIR